MHILNNPQTSQPKNASFGMALKITKPALEALEKSNMETINRLTRIGEDLADTKFYHLEIGDGLKPRIDSTSANSYVGSFVPLDPNDNVLVFKAVWDGSESLGLQKGKDYNIAFAFENRKAAQAAYEKIKKLDIIDRAAELTKMLDKRAVEKEAKKAEQRVERMKVREAAAKLMSRFGGETHIK